MKQNSILRSFLCVAGSSLLAVSAAPADTLYWDSDGDGTAGFGSAAGTWSSLGTGNSWSTSPTGDGVGGAAVADYTTTTSDDLFFGTSTVNYAAGTTINGTVKAKSISQSNSHTGFTAGTAPVIDFGATGSYESLKSTASLPVLTFTGAGTSLTWISSRNMNVATVTVSNTGKTILQTSATSLNSYPSRVAMASVSSLGPVAAGLEFNGATLRMNTGFPYTSLSALNTDHPVTFILNKNSGLDNSVGGSTFTVDLAIDLGSGKFYAEGGTGSIVKLTQANTWAGTHLTSAALEISDSSHLGAITSPFTFGSGNAAELSSGNLRIAGTSMTSLGARPLFTTPTKSVGFDIVEAANTFTVDKELDQTTGTFTKAGIGTLVLIQDNTFTGASTLTGGGTLVLDYTGENGSKLSDSAALTLSNSNLTLKNGSHPEIVSATTLGAGHSHIASDGGSSSIDLNAITRAYGGTISFSAASIATTDTNHFGASGANGILGGWATIGNDWAVSANTGAANTAITALASESYNTTVSGSGSATTNYRLEGATSLVAPFAAGSLKIVNTADSQTLDLGANNLTITCTNATTLGGIMYAGGNDNLYSITGTGRIQTSGGGQELIFAVNTGTLTVSCFVGAATTISPVTKSGAGKLVLTNSTTTTGVTRVNQGTLLVNNTSGNGIGTGTVTVFNKAILGGTGTIGGNTIINAGGGLTFDITTAAGSHDPLELAAAKSLTFGGASTLTITSSGGTPAAGIYTLVTAPGGIIGTLPSTVVLPAGWTASAPTIDGTSLKINITSTGAAGYASWKAANAGGQDPDLDFDNDGVDNGVEYFMNASAGFTASPAIDGIGTITWPNGGNILPGAYGTEYVIQTSSDLSTWTDVLVGDLTTNTPGPGGSLTYTLTGAAPRFVRLKVTPN